jgi:hypothetical protein
MAVIPIGEDEAFIRELAELMVQDLGHHALLARCWVTARRHQP